MSVVMELDSNLFDCMLIFELAAAAAAATAAAVVTWPQTYNWVTEVEIEFGDGRLGVSLREVRQLDTTPYPQFQAEVDDLPKINGKAGPAELYNWSVKPHKCVLVFSHICSIASEYPC